MQTVEPKTPLSAADISDALKRIFQSQSFVNSVRLQEFLSYIVQEQTAGRGAAIKGKTIAVNVYKREIDEDGSAQNLVRVEARRLRRALEEYYLNEGEDERLKIHVEAGSYRPKIVVTEPSVGEPLVPVVEVPSESPVETPASSGFWVSHHAAMVAGVSFLVLVVVVAVSFFRPDTSVLTDERAQAETAELAALRERSLASVQALNTATQARGTFFPLFDVKRQRIALETYQHATELDPSLPAGYAGMAQVLALLSMLTPDEAQAQETLTRAKSLSMQALDVGPTDAWANASNAWVLAVSGDFEEALRRADIAMRLAPEDGHLLDLIGISAILAGDAELTAEVSDPSRPRTGEGRFGAGNIWGVAQLLLQNYDTTIEVFSTSAQNGLPISGPTLMLLATAHQQVGDTEAARRAIEEMIETWPDFPAEAVAARFFERHPETLQQINKTLQAYSPPMR